MRAAVITPYFKEGLEILERCHLSVLDQEVSCRHFLVADGFANEAIREWDCEHFSLPTAHNDNGNTPRAIGALSAINKGYQVIFFLDADNWLLPNHVGEALRLKAEDPSLDIAILRRQIVLPDGAIVPDDREDKNKTHADTSCYAFFESSFSLIPFWGMMPTFLSPICDRIMLSAIRTRRFNIAWSPEKTVYYTSNYRNHYIQAGRVPPAKTNDFDMSAIIAELRQNPELLRTRTGLDLFH
jgi:glycosyltransferase involved in cell wall biosynthesis